MATGASSALTYSIGVTAKLTGVPAETLRAWERRYGSPRPQRHPGGQRSYDDAEVARLRLIARAIEAGHRAREVVPLSRAALESLEGHAHPHAAVVPPTTDIGPCLEAIQRDDAPALGRELRNAALLFGPLGFLSRVAHPLAVEVGRLWEKGDLDVRQEHLFTACLSTQLRVLLATMEPAGKPTVVLATFPGELHALGLEMVAVHIAVRGASPRLLGPSLPPKEIASAAEALGADAIGISVSGALPRGPTERQARSLLASTKRPLWLGGAGAAALRVQHRRVKVVDGWEALDETLAR